MYINDKRHLTAQCITSGTIISFFDCVLFGKSKFSIKINLQIIFMVVRNILENRRENRKNLAEFLLSNFISSLFLH